MTRQASASKSLLVLLLVIAIFGMLPVHRVQALGTLSIQPSKIPSRPQGTTITVSVRVNNMDLFNGWDIAIQTNQTALNGTAINPTAQTISSQGSVLTVVECINSVNQTLGACDPSVDGPGIVHVAGVVFPAPNAPISGTLFSINFTTGSYAYTSLNFVKYRLVYATGNGSPDVPHNTMNAFYGNPPPDFQLQLVDQSLSLHQGTTGNSTLTVSSISSFNGRVNLTYAPNAKGITPTGPDYVLLNSTKPSVNVTITVSLGALTPIPGAYQINLRGTSGRLSHSAILDLSITGPPDFTIGSPAGNIQIPQATTGNTSIVLTAGQDFAGNVSLGLSAIKNVIGQRITLCSTCVASLAENSLNVPRNGSNSTTFSISIPPSSFAYNYLINVTATYVRNQNLNHTYTIRVSPLPYDILGATTPNLLTIKAGSSGFALVTITSENYFIGSVYASSTLSGGTARYNQTTSFLPIGGGVSFSLNVTIDSLTAPGNYTAELTVYSGTGIAHQIPLSIVVESSGQSHIVTRPATILSLTPTTYFGILGGFAAVFVVLTALVYRKSRLESAEGL